MSQTETKVIHAATTPRQVTATTTLADLADPATAPLSLPAPVVAVIGDVVSLRASLGFADLMPTAAGGTGAIA